MKREWQQSRQSKVLRLLDPPSSCRAPVDAHCAAGYIGELCTSLETCRAVCCDPQTLVRGVLGKQQEREMLSQGARGREEKLLRQTVSKAKASVRNNVMTRKKSNIPEHAQSMYTHTQSKIVIDKGEKERKVKEDRTREIPRWREGKKERVKRTLWAARATVSRRQRLLLDFRLDVHKSKNKYWNFATANMTIHCSKHKNITS